MRKRRGVTSPLPIQYLESSTVKGKERRLEPRTELQQYGLDSDILRERDVYDQLYGKKQNKTKK